MNILGIIPARSGSKGLKNKNISKLLGKPLIQYTIDAAKKSKYVNKIVVSTDSDKIGKLSKFLGAEVPFIRPKKYATDNSSTLDVVKHVVKTLKQKENYDADIITILQPTSPLRKSRTIDESIELLKSSQRYNSVLGVHLVKTHPYASFNLKKGALKPFKNNFKKFYQRQTFPDLFFPTGSVYTFWRKTLEKYNSYLGPNIKPLIINDETIIDVDDKFDLFLCEMILKHKQKIS